ncbi:MAG: ABC transporter ATP-binding protein [Deltaproteobacteria bacterium]
MIEIKNVTKRFGKLRAVDSVSLEVAWGEAVALLGSNGAGKSTLIKCILGILDFTGEIAVNGIDVRKHSKKAKSLIGYLPQEPVFYDMKTIDIIRFFARLRKVDGKIGERVLSEVGLAGHSSKYASELSGGMRQRLSFAIALLSEPEVLLLDEPTSNLDARARGEFLNLVREYKKGGKTVVFSSHRLDEVDYLADRAALLRDGKLVLEDSPGNLAESVGLALRMNIQIPEEHIREAVDILARAGVRVHGKNGRGIIVEVSAVEKMKPLNELMTQKIPVIDFTMDEPSMENILDSEGGNGY